MNFETIGGLLLGIFLLTAGAEALIRGSSRLAAQLGVSALVIGLTVVAFGTSAPELAISVQAALNGSSDLVIGNVVGSNIFNVLFIMGICALIRPMRVDMQLLRVDVPILVAASVLTLLMALDNMVGRAEGAMLFGGLIAYIVFAVISSRKHTKAEAKPFEERFGAEARVTAVQVLINVALVVLGLAVLVAGSHVFIAAAVKIARAFGLSELIVGLTIVAAGTSLPEVAASVVAAFKGERSIAIGNIIGSSIFNLLGVLGSTALISGGGVMVSADAIRFDLPVMLATAVACMPVFYVRKGVFRWEGLMFLLYYVAYVTYLIMDASGAAALRTFSHVMLGFVIPLTIVTLAVLVVREDGKRQS